MNMTLRRATLEDAKQCGIICYSAFKAIAYQHNFPPGFRSPKIAIKVLSAFLKHPDIYGVVAKLDGKVVDSNFVDECSIIAGIAPITADPRSRSWTEVNATHYGADCRATLPKYRLVQAAYKSPYCSSADS